jgi:hypothetical protein
MRNRISIIEPETTEQQSLRLNRNTFNSSTDPSVENDSLRILNSEGHESFVNYIEWLGLGKDPDMLVLSSLHHYYYDAEEMKHVRTVINVKELNQIKNIEDFIYSINHILSPKSYFLGCFTDNKKTNGYLLSGGITANNSRKRSEAVENGIVSRIPFLNMMFSIMDSKTNSFLSKRSVRTLLEDHGFKVVDITDLNNRTFFCAQKIDSSGN